jgi:hypothetical protein
MIKLHNQHISDSLRLLRRIRTLLAKPIGFVLFKESINNNINHLFYFYITS